MSLSSSNRSTPCGLAVAVAASFALALSVQTAGAATPEWPRFRGVDGAGIAEGARLPVAFGPKTNLSWQTAVPEGCSSPVIAGNRVWIAGFLANSRLVWCLDLKTGHRLWERFLEAKPDGRKSPPNDAASSTPVTDGLNVYAFFSGFGLVSYDPFGRERWRVPLGPFTQPHGMASSPILADHEIVLLADQLQDSYVAAYDTETGAQKWRAVRPNFVGGYSTPVFWHDQIIAAGPVELCAYDPGSGTRLWAVPKMGVMPIGSPALAEGKIVVNNGAVPPFEALSKMVGSRQKFSGKITPEEFPDPSFQAAVRTIDRVYGNGDGAIDQAEWDGALKLMETLNTLSTVDLTGPRPTELWRSTKILADVSSPLLYQGVLYLLKDGGLLTGMDPGTGEVLWRERVSGSGSRYFASPIAGDGKVYLVGEDGQATVVKSGRDFHRLSLNKLDEPCYATPAIAGELLLIRTVHMLWAFADGK